MKITSEQLKSLLEKATNGNKWRGSYSFWHEIVQESDDQNERMIVCTLKNNLEAVKILICSVPDLAAEVLELRGLLADMHEEHGGRCDCSACKRAEEYLADTED